MDTPKTFKFLRVHNYILAIDGPLVDQYLSLGVIIENNGAGCLFLMSKRFNAVCFL